MMPIIFTILGVCIGIKFSKALKSGLLVGVGFVGAFIIPVCLGVNILMLLTKTTRTVNIDLWNYWHFAFIGAVVYFASDNIWWGFFAAVICYIITHILADYTADRFQKFYDKMDGISIPQPFCQGFVPFAEIINKGLDKIP